jgi:hypothetical protein
MWSSIWDSYRNSGHSDPNRIAVIVNEIRFFWHETMFTEIYFYEESEAWIANRRWLPDEAKLSVSKLARDLALDDWVREFRSREAALADPNLPESLKDKVREIEIIG